AKARESRMDSKSRGVALRKHARSPRHTPRGRMPDREAAGGAGALQPPRRETAVARHADQLRQPARFRLGHDATEWRDPVIAPPLVVQVGLGALPRLDEQPLLEHALNGAVQSAGAQLQLSIGPRSNVLNDGVSMPVFIGDGQQNMERRWRKRQQRSGIHAAIIATVDISSAIERRSKSPDRD